MSIFDDIQKKKDEDLKKETEKRIKAIQEVKQDILDLLKKRDFNIQDASLALKTTQDAINGSLLNRPLSECL